MEEKKREDLEKEKREDSILKAIVGVGLGLIALALVGNLVGAGAGATTPTKVFIRSIKLIDTTTSNSVISQIDPYRETEISLLGRRPEDLILRFEVLSREAELAQLILRHVRPDGTTSQWVRAIFITPPKKEVINNQDYWVNSVDLAVSNLLAL